MKTLISNSEKPISVKTTPLIFHPLLLSFFFLLLSFSFPGSATIPQEKSLNSNELRSKRLDILEKLESGKPVNTEDINKSMGNRVKAYMEPGWIFLPEEPPLRILPDFPEIHTFIGPFYYHYPDGREHVIISDNDIKDFHKRLMDNMEELKKDMESFKNSEEFMIMHDELQKWNDNFRKELDKIKEDLIKSNKEFRSKGTTHIHL